MTVVVRPRVGQLDGWQAEECGHRSHNGGGILVEVLAAQDQKVLAREDREPGPELVDVTAAGQIRVVLVVEADITIIFDEFCSSPANRSSSRAIASSNGNVSCRRRTWSW